MTDPEPEPLDITLEEWIAAGQACCGIEPDDEPAAASPCPQDGGKAPPAVDRRTE